ncbi:energy transducer TonB [Algoriphagus halophytocola]|uniref:energy transducer TonB n=1 Tax=Algoriphagus halophytocola TaxID=2991499 RepID=UPI0022DD42D2|nr:energy transducer TonB [Algoriphagus sp. TR-M9]WBL43750.1 energy transducer TonB [Algoriphagus sp. TR-M9]
MRSTLYFLLFLISFTGQTLAQERNITFLNQHMFPTSDNSAYAYKSVCVESADGNSITRVFTLSNQLEKIIKVSFNEEGQFEEELTETYNAQGELISKKVKNLANGRYLIQYFDNGEFIGESVLTADRKYETSLPGVDKPILSDHDPLAASPHVNQEEWTKHLVNNLRYPSQSRRLGEEGTVVLALLISTDGELHTLEVANPAGLSKHLSEEAIRVTRAYQGKYFAGKDPEGNLVESWLYIPIRFKLS